MTDEANVKESESAEFFTYGGLIVELAKVAELHERIASLRQKYGYKTNDQLKFDTNVRPKHVSVEAAKNIKQELIEACIETNCKFIAYVILHKIARTKDIHTLVKWGSDHVFGKFNYFLTTKNAHGMVVMDRLPAGVEFEYLAEKFTDGLSIEGGSKVSMDKVILFSSTCINASHLSSAMDVVLGSWRYCINQPFNKGAASLMIKDITKLIWCERDGENIYAHEKGLILRPKTVAVEMYRKKYDDLLSGINNLLKTHN